MQIKYCNWLKNSYVSLLRFCFAHDSTPQEYKYSQDNKQNKIAIYRGFPRRPELFPCLVIEAEASNASMSYLGEEMFSETRDADDHLVSVNYGGSLTIPVKITIMARTITDAERLTDLCAIYIRYLFRNKFAKYGFAYTHIHVSADSQEEADNEPVFVKTITVDNYTEFTANVDGSLFLDIERISLDFTVLSPTSTITP